MPRHMHTMVLTALAAAAATLPCAAGATYKLAGLDVDTSVKKWADMDAQLAAMNTLSKARNWSAANASYTAVRPCPRARSLRGWPHPRVPGGTLCL